MRRFRPIVSASILVCASAACAPRTAEVTPPPPPEIITDTVVISDTVVVQDGSQAEAQIARLQIQLLEHEQRIRALNEELAASRQEVVRNLAKLQSQASRAEAASGLSEAEIAVEQLGRLEGGRDLPEYVEAQARIAEGSAEFTAQNFGGALYLATEARRVARSGQQRLSAVGESAVAGETLFAVPVSLHTLSRANVRSGPSLDFGVLLTLDPGTELTGRSYTSQWVRVIDGEGREGWIFHTLVGGGDR